MLRNLPFLINRGFRNIFKHKAASFFSLGVMVATIFLFSAAYALLVNINSVVKQAQDSIGITVFFNEGMSETEIMELGLKIGEDENVSRMIYTSAEEAWENFKKIYFAGQEELAEGFIENNPLANSASYEIFLEDISKQSDFISYLQSLYGVRKVNYSNVVAEGLSNVGKVVEIVTIAILALLLVVSVSLISNSISLTIAMRQEEIHIMRYIGATNSFIRFPFVMEGAIIGLIGAAIPLVIVYYAYDPLLEKLNEKLAAFSGLLEFLSREQVFAVLVPVGLVLGLGIGILGSRFSMRRHLKA